MAHSRGWVEYRSRWLVPLVLPLVLLAGWPAAPVAAQTWDPGPLQTPTPVPRDGLAPERGVFLAWLTGQRLTLTETETRQVRERLYAYISELAKERGGRFPAPGDTTAAYLFRLAAGLGVPGADQVARTLAPRVPVAPVTVPAGLTLALRDGGFTLASDDASWAVCFPWYFMPMPAGRQVVPANQVSTEIAVLSTLFAPDGGAPGSSQATVLVLAAPIADSAKHVGLWLGQLGLAPAPAAGPAALGEWHDGPAGDPMRRQAVVHRLPGRVMVLAYVGLAGTFEANRPHFLDLARTLAAGQCRR